MGEFRKWESMVLEGKVTLGIVRKSQGSMLLETPVRIRSAAEREEQWRL